MAPSHRTLTRLILLAVIVLCGSHTLWGCPNVGKLTITYSWIPYRVVGVQNSGVPSSAVDTALANWNSALGDRLTATGLLSGLTAAAARCSTWLIPPSRIRATRL
jgi:hypothetical protein